MTRAAALSIGLVLGLGCADKGDAAPPSNAPGATASAPWFTEEAHARGLDFTYESGARGEYLMPEIMGGGAALFDADGDGDLDAYLVQGGGVRVHENERRPNRLFANDGAGRFSLVDAAGDRGYGMGVACGDADGDGDVDLYVTNVGRDALLLNQRALAFAAADPAELADGWSTSAAFFDADLDGDLDLYVARYVVWDADQELACSNDMGSPDYCNPTAYGAPALDVYLANEGAGRFRDASARAGIQAAAANGLGVVCADFDRDGFPDVFVANDQNPDLLWSNRGDGTFADRAAERGVALDRDGRAKAGMGVAVGDVDRDGDEDLLVCNLSGESDSLFENRGAWFADRTLRARLGTASRPYTRFGVGWADFDQDGFLDLFVADGRVMRRRPAFDTGDDYAEPNLAFRGLGDGTFDEVANGGLARALVATSRAAAFGDVDGDGALDVLVVNRDAPAHLLMNRAAPRGNAVTLAVVDPHGAPALGASVDLVIGGAHARVERREVRSASSYLAASSPWIHVGLGTAEQVDEVHVRWPDGAERRFGPIPAGAGVVRLSAEDR
jgi:hypothetical protein